MKKLLTTILCLVLTMSIVLATGCKEDNLSDKIFEGNYTEVQASEITAFNATVGESGKEVDMSKGIKFEFIQNEMDDDEYEKINVSFNTSLLDEIFVMKGRITQEEKDDGNDKNIDADIYYSGDTLYCNDGVSKTCQKIPLKSYISSMTMGFSALTLENVETVISRLLNIKEFKYYKEVGESVTKIKFEFSEREDLDERKSGIILFTYNNTQNNLIAVNVKIVEDSTSIFDKDEYDETIMNIEGWSGDIDLPADLDTYQSTAFPVA